MSGHSKWSQIKRQKGVADQKRGKVFGKLVNTIIIAAKNGSDPSTNFQLKIAIDRAKSVNMPKENIERAIKRGSGQLGEKAFEEVLFEAISSENIGIIIEAATDNKNRTASVVRGILTKYNAKITDLGTVTYQFEKMGKFDINIAGKDQEGLELKVIDAGADDFEEQDDILEVFTKPNELGKVKKALEEKDIFVKDVQLIWEPKNLIEINDEEKAQKILLLMEELENLEDITAVYANFDMAEKIMK